VPADGGSLESRGILIPVQQCQGERVLEAETTGLERR